ncbi:hypothetical protein HLB44_14505 [Aquincola sp. S2]|uniref:DUF883 domain-containing protein n=1 Tax=Pseudaquabacterium terrae TaxID=2732868 RepID=A0ABX2EHT6_9BURK|nr:hypothetical protein [Aquabacterium terrae]NRF68202.1 hypothetical protein [Aquabacterium terrae]
MANEFPTQTSNPTTTPTGSNTGVSRSTGPLGSPTITPAAGVAPSGLQSTASAKPIGADGTPGGATPATGDATTERTLERAVKATHEAVDRAAGSVEQAADKLRTSMDKLNSLEQEWAETLRTRVREHPLASCAAALAVGLMIGRISAPSRHDRRE